MRKIILYAILLTPLFVLCQTDVQKQLSDVSSRLDVICKNEEIMIPRVTLKSRFDKSTVVDADTKFILVFNTANCANILSGYYYWYDSKWNNLRNLIEQKGVPKDNGKTGDIFIDFSTRDVYFFNGTLWLSMSTHNEAFKEVVFEDKSGVLRYKDNTGEDIVINLSEIIPNFNKPKTISLNAAKKTLNYIDENGGLTIIKLDVLLTKSKKVNLTSAF
ncbi:hypothetical protein [Flavobacterium collinsii]|uniref:Uncharacterized protein n=1 Tax=Flavobacterium collinsii TaxID=1114861 RepID=A0A9W4TL22_9FLAO|nr:hypothetical protein [Flavobacterium collinsii]CAI2767930.1 conserved exported protein of unknown function [Flavobacterium collinsii]